MARFADHLGAVCRVFKVLKYLNPSTNSSDSFNQPIRELGESLKDTAAENAVGGRDSVSAISSSNGDSTWNWVSLTRTLPINPATVARLRQADVPPWALVAWVLRTMTMKGVKIPNLAISKVQSPVECLQAGADFVLLAKHPTELLREIRKTAIHRYGQLGDVDEFSQAYCQALGKEQTRAVALWQLLTGKESIE